MQKKFEIDNEVAAAAIAQKLTAGFNILGDSILLVREHTSEQDATTFRNGIGDAFHAIVSKLLEPIYEQYPGLKPLDWDSAQTDAEQP
jgi:hypothetical protein